jgi:hypothetical protein
VTHSDDGSTGAAASESTVGWYRGEEARRLEGSRPHSSSRQEDKQRAAK